MNGTTILALCLLVPWALLLGALVIDLRTGKSYALGLLALVLLLALVAVTVGVAYIAANPPVLRPGYYAGGLEVVFLWLLLLACAYLVWVVEIGVLVEATRAKHKRWVWAIALVMLLQAVVAVPPFAALVWVGTFGLLAFLLVSTATVLAFCLRRTFQPAARMREMVAR